MDISIVEKELNKIKGKDETTSHFWKPPEGESRVRVVPYKFNPEFPFTRIPFHYLKQPDGQTKVYISPSYFGEPDPVLEFCQEIRKKDKSKEAWILSKRLEPKPRVFAPVVVRGQEDRGTRFWAFSPKVYESILEKIKNPDYGDITDIQQGHDLIVVFEKKPSGKKYPETKVDIRLKPTPLLDNANKDLIDKILNEQVELVTLFKKPTYEELFEAFKLSLEETDLEQTNDNTQGEQQQENSVYVYNNSSDNAKITPSTVMDPSAIADDVYKSTAAKDSNISTQISENTSTQEQPQIMVQEQPQVSSPKLSMSNEEIMARLRSTLLKK